MDGMLYNIKQPTYNNDSSSFENNYDETILISHNNDKLMILRRTGKT